MVDREFNPTPEGGAEPFFVDPSDSAEFQARFTRIEQLTVASRLIYQAIELDAVTTGLTKSFLSRAAASDMYPFNHLRLKLKPKNRAVSPLKVVAFRYPTSDPFILLPEPDPTRLFVAWEQQNGAETTYVLRADGFHTMQLDTAFGVPGEDGNWPTPVSLTPASDEDTRLFASVLTDFELDLQDHDITVQP